MNEHNDVKSALIEILNLCEAQYFTVDGKPITVEDFQDMVKGPIFSIADLLGMEEIYLDR